MLTMFILFFCRCMTGLLFLTSALGKASNTGAFEQAIHNFDLLPEAWIKYIAWLFLLGEFAVVLMMLTNQLLLPGFILAIFLLGTFSTALLITLTRKNRVVCNCFGRAERHISIYDVVRNILFGSCAILGTVIALLLGSSGIRNPFFIDAIWLLLGSAIIMIWLLNLHEIATLFKQPSRVR